MSPNGDRLRSWWTDNPNDPGRPGLENHHVHDLLGRIAPDEDVVDLGGTMNLNIQLVQSNRVLRVHRDFVSHERIECEQGIRRHLRESGVSTPETLMIEGNAIVRCGTRWAELETFLASSQPPHQLESYDWLFTQMGRVHEALGIYDRHIPRSLAATWGPYGSLRRWFATTLPQLEHVRGGPDAARRVRRLLSWLRTVWVPTGELPAHLIHGDFRLGNIRQDAPGQTVVLDFGFADIRPRCYDVAYSLAFMVLALGTTSSTRQVFDDAIAAYDASAPQPLSKLERTAIAPMAASALLHAFAHDGYTGKIEQHLPHRLPFLEAAEWIATVLQ